MRKVIPVAGPFIDELDQKYVLDAVTNGWYEDASSYIEKFEDAFKNYVGRKYAVSLPSCTSALHLSLLALEIKKDDEVILPDVTWIASAAPIKYVGATPVFADIDYDNWCICTKSVQKLITSKTKAIISVNLYGHMPNYDQLAKLGIPIIEDAAESIGSTYKEKLSGSFGIASCFSFHGSKTMTTGEGGMLLTDDDDIYQRVQVLRDHGRQPGDVTFRNAEVGYKYKMSNIQAALGLAQLEKIDRLVAKKRKIFSSYQERLSQYKDVLLNPFQRDVENSYWMSTAVFPEKYKKDKFSIMDILKKKGVSSRPFFSPLSSLGAFKEEKDIERAKNENKVSYNFPRFGVNLPSALSLKSEEVNYVVDMLEEHILNSNT